MLGDYSDAARIVARKVGTRLTELHLENVSLRYAGRNVLENINLTVNHGELCTVVGPSGCGKSLILRIIAGLVKPSKGEVYFNGRPISHVSPGARDIAMVFQNFALYPYMSVRDNWAFPLRAEKLPVREIDARIAYVAALLQMEVLLDRRPTQLSGGQKQRAALGRALVRRPTLFLWDEPLGAQDAKRRVELRTELKKLQMDMRITTICVTSDQIEALSLGDKVVVMDVGSIQQVGTPEEIYDHPTNLFVASFVGNPRMNFFDATLQWRGDRLTVQSPYFELVLPPLLASRVDSANVERAVVVGVRPEDIAVHIGPTPDGIKARVYVAEPESNQILIDFRLGDQIVRTRCDRDELDFEPEIDQQVYLVVKSNALHLFDKASGQRIG